MRIRGGTRGCNKPSEIRLQTNTLEPARLNNTLYLHVPSALCNFPPQPHTRVPLLAIFTSLPRPLSHSVLGYYAWVSRANAAPSPSPSLLSSFTDSLEKDFCFSDACWCLFLSILCWFTILPYFLSVRDVLFVRRLDMIFRNFILFISCLIYDHIYIVYQFTFCNCKSYAFQSVLPSH